MKTLTVASILIAGGLILLLYALFFMDTSVPVNYPDGNNYGMPERVVNLDLLAQRQIYVIASIASIMVGLVLFFISNPKAKNIPAIANENKKCPQCAELIKKEAKICRFCNYQFTVKELSEIK